MDSAFACMKYVLFTMNFLIWCFGGALTAVGVWIRTDGDFWEYHKGFEISNYYQACYVIMTVGAVLLIVGFLGCCGAAVDSPCMLLTYIIIMATIVVLELAAAGLVWKIGDGDKFQEYITREILKKIEERKYNRDAENLIDKLQMHLECCGANDFTDYGLDQVPRSCSSDRTNNIFIYGCGEHLRRMLEQKGGIVGGLVLGIGLIQVISLVFTTCLLAAMKSEEKDYV